MSADKKPGRRKAREDETFAQLQQRLKIQGDLITMMRCLPTERLLQLARELAPEASARLKELGRPRLIVDNTR